MFSSGKGMSAAARRGGGGRRRAAHSAGPAAAGCVLPAVLALSRAAPLSWGLVGCLGAAGGENTQWGSPKGAGVLGGSAQQEECLGACW